MVALRSGGGFETSVFQFHGRAGWGPLRLLEGGEGGEESGQLVTRRRHEYARTPFH